MHAELRLCRIVDRPNILFTFIAISTPVGTWAVLRKSESDCMQKFIDIKILGKITLKHLSLCFLYLHIYHHLNYLFLCFQAECFAALESIAQKVNERDADMRSHIVLSMFKVRLPLLLS